MEEREALQEYHLNRHQPDKPQFLIHDLKSYVAANQGKANKPHIHSFFQIIWFTKGQGKHFVDFKAYDVSDNSIFFIAKNQVHYFDDGLDYEGTLIHFSELFLGSAETGVEFLVRSNLFNNPYQFPSCCVDSELIRFINLVDEHYTKGLLVAEYAGLMHISPRTLSDLSAQTLNKTPLLVIQERVILEAQRLLVHSNLNVNQIGFRLGFDDPSYFVKYFKKHTQVSPSEFRKSIA